jgi:hypothetical protein
VGVGGAMGHSAPSLLFYFDGTWEALCNSLRLVVFKKHQYTTSVHNKKTCQTHCCSVSLCKICCISLNIPGEPSVG